MNFFSHFVAFIPYLSSWQSTVIAAALNIPSAPPSINQIGDIERSNTSLTSHIPSQFGAVALPQRGERFVDFDCLALTVKVVGELASYDFEASVAPREWTAGSLSIGLSLTGAPRGTRGIQMRYIIWGIYVGATEMMQTRDFRGIVYGLQWQGEVVGVLGFYKPQLLISLPSSSDAFSKTTRKLFMMPLASNDTNPSVPSSNFGIVTVADPGLEVMFLQFSEPTRALHPFGVYTSILALLITAAEKTFSDPIRSPLAVNPAGSGVQAIVTGPDDTSKPMTRPPYFTWKSLCRALITTSNFLLRSKYFEVFKVRLLIDHVEIGNINFGPHD